MRLPQKILVWVLYLSTLVEIVITAKVFLWPESAARDFSVAFSPEVRFLGQVIGCFTLMFAANLLYTAKLIRLEQAQGRVLAQIAGVFFLIVGLVLFNHSGQLSFLAVNSLRGVMILGLLFWDQKPRRRRA